MKKALVFWKSLAEEKKWLLWFEFKLELFVFTWIMSFISALSVDILAFFMTETVGPTHVTNTNLLLLLISSPVCKVNSTFKFMWIQLKVWDLSWKIALILMYPNPRSSLPKKDLNWPKSLPVAVTPKLLPSNLNTALRRKFSKIKNRLLNSYG